MGFLVQTSTDDSFVVFVTETPGGLVYAHILTTCFPRKKWQQPTIRLSELFSTLNSFVFLLLSHRLSLVSVVTEWRGCCTWEGEKTRFLQVFLRMNWFDNVVDMIYSQPS